VEIGTVPLKRELTLFEYDTCAEADQVSALFGRREALRPYLKKRLLEQSFRDDEPCLRATHYVGLLPFSDADRAHLLLIAPKGCRQDEELGLLRFLELLALAEGEGFPEGLPGLQGRLGPHRFLLFLARYYANLLRELCRRDFRSYYRQEQGELRSHIRGRLHLASHAQLTYRGKQHLLPCRWEEFTLDNWDNRILWAAARRLKHIAAGTLGSEAAGSVWNPFQPLVTWFSTVSEEEPITVADFRKSRLGRTSCYYRHALAWARLLLQGGDLPRASGRVPPLVLDTHGPFERFAQGVALAALPAGWKAVFQEENSFLDADPPQSRKPDIFLSSPTGMRAVGDAKYKQVLEHAGAGALQSGREAQACIQAADWNQLYVYMRIKQASYGFFVVPFWQANGRPTEWLDRFAFSVSPSEARVKVGVLALNLLCPLKEVREKAKEQLRTWLSVPQLAQGQGSVFKDK
jgi:hypothetical protein